MNGPSTSRSAAAAGGRAASAPLLGREEEPTIFDFSVPGRRSASFRTTGVPEWAAEELVPPSQLRPEPAAVAEISERDSVAHMTRLSHRQYSVDLGAYPLGSCTMKYNPKVCDEAAALPGLTYVHPATPAAYAQGWLELLWRLGDTLVPDDRHARGHAAATRGSLGRTDGPADNARLAPPAGPGAEEGHYPGLRPRDQPGFGQPGRFQHRERAIGRAGPREHRALCASTWTTTWPASC